MSETKSFHEINIEQLVPFPNHPFELYDERRSGDMIESVRARGILSPIIVRPIADSKYEILSGHNRVHTAKIVGLKTVPAVVKEDLTDEEAFFIVTETNLIQRSFADMKLSERALVITVHYDAIKKKAGYRTDLLVGVKEDTGVPVAPKSKTSSKIGVEYGLSADTIRRYIRINKLIQSLKDYLDNERIAFRTAVSLSYLRNKEQDIVAEVLAENYKINMNQAEMLRKKSVEKPLGRQTIKHLLQPKKPSAKAKPLKISRELLSEFFDETNSADEIENTIAEALRAYMKK